MSVRDQIVEQLRWQIESGTLRPGTPLPSERELAEQLGASRMSIRAAVDELANEGLLVRRPRRATLVAGDKINRSASFMSFSEEMRLRGWRPRSTVRQLIAMTADVSVAAQLDLDLGSKVVYLERLRYADDEPLALERVYLPYSHFNAVIDVDLTERSLYEFIEQELGIRPSYAEESVEAVLLSTDEADIFGVPSGSPALLSRRITRDVNDMAIEVSMSLYRGDLYRMALIRRR